MRSVRYLLVLLAFVTVLTSCSSVYKELEQRPDSTGVTLTPEFVAEMSRELASSSEAAASSKAASKATSSVTERNTTSKNVTDKPDTQNPVTTKQDETVTPMSGEDTLEPSAEVTTASEATVYWTPGGSVWHISRSCSALKNSSEVLSGTKDEALAAGKERVCKKCGG